MYVNHTDLWTRGTPGWREHQSRGWSSYWTRLEEAENRHTNTSAAYKRNPISVCQHEQRSPSAFPPRAERPIAPPADSSGPAAPPSRPPRDTRPWTPARPCTPETSQPLYVRAAHSCHRHCTRHQSQWLQSRQWGSSPASLLIIDFRSRHGEHLRDSRVQGLCFSRHTVRV